MGTGEEISLVYRAVSKLLWESGPGCSDLLPAYLPAFLPRKRRLGGWLVNSQVLP